MVDSGSYNNETLEILEKYSTHPKMKVIYTYLNTVVPSFQRGIGILEAEGEFMAFLDDDDTLFRQKTEV